MHNEFMSLNITNDWAAVEWRHKKEHCSEAPHNYKSHFVTKSVVSKKGTCFKGMRSE